MSTALKQDERGTTLVELLVVVLLLGVIGTAIFGVLFTSNRTYVFSSDVREVMDDGRLSLERIRRELRSARRVYSDSTTSVLHFWVDQNQDAVEDPTEQVCYVVRSVETDRWRLVRWTADEVPIADVDDPCTVSTVPSTARTIAATLRSTSVFTFDCGGGSPCPPTDPASNDVVREVQIDFLLDVRTAAGPDTLPVGATVRLRNVA